MNKLKHQIKYINWRKEAKIQNLHWIDFDAVFNSLDPKLKNESDKTVRKNWVVGSWSMAQKNHHKYLYIHADVNKYIVYTTNWFSDDKNTGKEFKGLPKGEGRKAAKLVSDKFKELNMTIKDKPISLKAAFGYTEEEFKICVPKQLYYLNPMYLNRELFSVSSVDFCAHYPSCACGSLPDCHKMRMLKGTHKPTKEYPFAFYLKSGFVAEYNVFDSHDWAEMDQAKDLFTNTQKISLPPEEDITCLMKASKYELTDVYKYYYNLRESDPNAKLVENASIGYFHKQCYDAYKLTHLAAIIIGRANAKMLALAKKIGFRSIIQICVDGCLYIGKKEYGIKNKGLHKLYQEFTDKRGKITGTNKYIIVENDDTFTIVKAKHGACNDRDDGKDIDEVTSYDDMKHWIRNVPKSVEEEIYYGTKKEE